MKLQRKWTPRKRNLWLAGRRAPTNAGKRLVGCGLSGRDTDQLLRTFHHWNFSATRNAFLVSVLAFTKYRLHVVLGWRERDLPLMGLPAECEKWWKRYLRARRRYGFGLDDLLFCVLRQAKVVGGPLKDGYVRKMLAGQCWRLGWRALGVRALYKARVS